MVSYPLGIMVGHKNVCVRPRHPALVIEVLQCRYAILEERFLESCGVAEPVVVMMRWNKLLHLIKVSIFWSFLTLALRHFRYTYLA